ncbi:hypothetical protein J3998_12315 [Thiomicrorhabdus sp. 6S2-11]|uniref:Uncharacterized protein n=1 Tax=Thiomicrorhabdus marina TaxID=2818442 RepID=A0ABS3Q8U8_9GAMM|nr:hypothetical protein [Thiomicrorhabdus marina]MBO1928359.1 hypothetical protein [Thiomicrorhabdus marina]
MMWRLFILLTLITSISATIHADDTVKIGVLAKRGDVVAQNKWNNTANYLSQEIVDHQFEILPLDFNELKSLGDSTKKNGKL